MSEGESNGPEEGRPLRAVLDSDIIFSRVLHELLGRLAYDLDYFDLYWSDELLAEAERVLVEEKDPPIRPERAAQWVDLMRQAFPDCRVDISTLPEAVELEKLTDDPDDHHVCALAVVASADYLFSHDKKFNAAGLATHGVTLIRPDEFLVDAFNEDPETIAALLQRLLLSWSQGTRTLQDLLEGLHRAGAKRFAEKAAQHLGITIDPSRPVQRP